MMVFFLFIPVKKKEKYFTMLKFLPSMLGFQTGGCLIQVNLHYIWKTGKQMLPTSSDAGGNMPPASSDAGASKHVVKIKTHMGLNITITHKL